jgi:hypothetical protein
MLGQRKIYVNDELILATSLLVLEHPHEYWTYYFELDEHLACIHIQMGWLLCEYELTVDDYAIRYTAKLSQPTQNENKQI